MSYYNLLDEPWIPVIDKNNSTTNVSIINLLKNAHSYRAISGSNFFETFCITRLILAIMYRAWADELIDTGFWGEKWENPDSLYDDDMQEYLSTVHNRFYLADETYPFYQMINIDTKGKDPKSVNELSYDTEILLFNSAPKKKVLSPDQAARLLLTYQGLDVAGIKTGFDNDKRNSKGKVYGANIGWIGWLGAILLQGKNIHETLLLNFCERNDDDEDIVEQDIAPWEWKTQAEFTSRPDAKDTATPARGIVDLLTWQSRRVQLVWNDGVVTGMFATSGDYIAHAGQFGIETMTAWRHSKPQSKKFKQPTYMPLKIENAKPAWRFMGSVLPNNEVAIVDGNEEFKPSATVKWVETLMGEEVIERNEPITFTMGSVEYGSQNAVVENNSTTSFTVLSEIFMSDESLAISRKASTCAQKAGQALSRYARNMELAAGNRIFENNEQTNEHVQNFYSQISQLFLPWAATLTENEDNDLLGKWYSDVFNIANIHAEQIQSKYSIPQLWRGTTYTSGSTTKVMTESVAWRIFRHDLRNITAPQQEENS